MKTNGPNSHFCNVITEVGSKRLLPEIDAALREVTKAVNDTGCTGELTIKLKVKKATRAESGTIEMEVSGVVSTKIPKGAHPSSIFFLNEDTESLQREDPQQADMFPDKGSKPAEASSSI